MLAIAGLLLPFVLFKQPSRSDVFSLGAEEDIPRTKIDDVAIIRKSQCIPLLLGWPYPGY